MYGVFLKPGLLRYAAITLDVSDKLFYTVVGLAIAFFAMGIIHAIVSLYKIIKYDIPNSKKSTADKVTAEDTQLFCTNDSATQVQAPQFADFDDGMLAAVIAAAVAACLDAEAEVTGVPAPSFRVVSFRKTGK